MRRKDKQELYQAYKKEKNANVKIRLLAVTKFVKDNIPKREIARIIDVDPRTVRIWIKHFLLNGIDGLKDRPRTGRPVIVSNKILWMIFGQFKDPVTVLIFYEAVTFCTGVKYSTRQIRNRLHSMGLTVKKLTIIHRNKASQRKIIKWQKRIERLMKKCEKKGIPIISIDESMFENEYVNRAKYLGKKGEPVYGKYNGNHGVVATFGALTSDGRQLFRTKEKFNSDTFLEFLRDLVQRFGKKLMILLDKASPHTSKKVKEFLKQNEIIVEYFPTGTPELNPVEYCWKPGKRDILSAGYHSSYELAQRIGEYFRTTKIKLDFMSILLRDPLPTF